MIIKKDKQNEYKSNVELEGYDAKISEEDMHKLWDMLQDPYKNPIGAVVREYVSNCFDSHAEAGVDDAVLVTIDKDDSGWYWACEDYGVGLSPQRMKDVFCSYLKSTKENTNDMIGAFGLGSKSGLSYTDVVHIKTRFEGTEYLYMLCKSEKTPRLEKVFEYDTTERNGTEIKIYFKDQDYTHTEEIDFKEECRKQLCYFSNIYFENCDINNDYKIIEGEHWKYSTMSNPFGGLHMCIGSVAYPIDWDALGEEFIHLNVALKFEIGELDIIQTREDVKYTPRTKAAIRNKLELLGKELIDRWNKQDFEITDFKEWFEKYKGSKSYVLDYNDVRLDLEALLEADHLDYFYYKDFKGLDPNFKVPNHPFFEYKIEKKVTEQGHLKTVKIQDWSMYGSINSNYVYRIAEQPSSIKNKYIATEILGDYFYFLRVNKAIGLTDYKDKLNLRNVPKNRWREHIKVYQNVLRKLVKSLSESYKEVEVCEEWLLDQKKAKRNKLAEGKILTSAYVYDYTRGSNWKKGLKWKRYELDPNDKKTYVTMVGTKDQKDWVVHLSKIILKKLEHRIYKGPRDKFNHTQYRDEEEIYSNQFLVCTTASRNIPIIKENRKNVWTVEDFMTKNNTFKKVMTVLYIHQHHVGIFTHNFKIWEQIYSPLGKYLKDIKDASALVPVNKAWLTDNVLPVAIDNNLLDYELLNKAQFIEEYFKDLSLAAYFNEDTPPVEVAKYIYHYNKSIKNPKRFKKMDIHYYVNLNEEEKRWLEYNKPELSFIKYKEQVA